MGSKIVEMVINGNPVKVNPAQLLEITDLSEDMDKVASQLSYWGALWATAEGEKETADAFYRNWRARMGKKITASDPKMAEWKVRQRIEANPKFLEIKEKLGQAIYNATLCKTMCEAFRVKANMLQSKGAMQRAELDSTGMSTRRKEKKKVGTPDGDPKKTMKAIFKGKNK